MPYISQKYRNEHVRATPATAGELNYSITRLVDEYIGRFGLSYDSVNEAIGALECAKMELYRRIAAPYEDQKIQENGDVYINPPPRDPVADLPHQTQGTPS